MSFQDMEVYINRVEKQNYSKEVMRWSYNCVKFRFFNSHFH